MSIVIFFLPSSNTPVFGGVERGHVKETEADHGHRGPDGERSDEPEEEAQQPSVTNHQLEYRGHTDGALNLSDSLLAMVVVLIHYVQSPVQAEEKLSPCHISSLVSSSI